MWQWPFYSANIRLIQTRLFSLTFVILVCWRVGDSLVARRRVAGGHGVVYVYHFMVYMPALCWRGLLDLLFLPPNLQAL